MADVSQAKILAIKNITVLKSRPEGNLQKDFLLMGSYYKNTYRSYLYFDTSAIPENITLVSATLKLYVLNNYCTQANNYLYINPLLENFNENTSFSNQPKFDNKSIKYLLKNKTPHYLNINITDIFNRWITNPISNNGILLRCDETKNSLVKLTSNSNSSYAFVPSIDISYTENPTPETSCNNINIKRLDFLLTGNKVDVTPSIDVASLIQGTFFITNRSPEIITTILEVSADNLNWVQDFKIDVATNSTEVIVPKLYGNYYRIRCVSTNKLDSTIKFIYQYYKQLALGT